MAALDAHGQANGIVDWLLGEEARALDDAGLVEGLGRRLRDAGLPLDRLSWHLRMLHPELITRTLAWAPGEAVERLDRRHGIEALALFANSPLRRVMETRQPATVHLEPGEPDDSLIEVFRHRGLAELAILLPLRQSDGRASAVVFATARPRGFSAEERQQLPHTVPTLDTILALRDLRRAEQILLDTYVGTDTGRRVLDGNTVGLSPGLFQPIAADDVASIVAEVALAAPRSGIVEIAGQERAPFNEIVARYLKAVGDPREVVYDPEARYFGGRVEEHSLVPLGEARLGRIGLDEWLRRSQAGA